VRSFVVRRLVQAVTVAAAVTTLTFVLIHLAPGDPLAGTMDDPRVAPSVRAHWRQVYGLDRPLPVQYVRFLTGVARGDLGFSVSYNEPVIAVIRRAVPNTLMLAGTALVLSFAAGILIAVIQVRREGTLTDRALGAISLGLYSLPDFWLAQVALLAFSYWLPIFPAGGTIDPVIHPYLGPAAAALDRVRHLVLPAVTLAALTAAWIARFQRAALLDVAADDYLRTARAKGLSEWTILVRHALRNALLPVITLFGLSLSAFVSGAVFVEKVFGWPGIGSVAVDAVGARDYPVIIACTIIGSILVAAGSLIADLLYMLADPRLRRAEGDADGGATSAVAGA